MKICLFGGTFNPIHNGHIGMCLEAIKQEQFDKLFVIPAGNSYFKNGVTAKEHRANMVKLAIENLDDNLRSIMEYSDVEIVREGPSYSIDTINYYKNVYPESDVYFMIGEDTVYNILKWYKPEEIINNSILLVLERKCDEKTNLDNYLEYLKDNYNARCKKLSYSYDISSTEIRNMINDENVKDYLDENVLKYIKNNNLY